MDRRTWLNDLRKLNLEHDDAVFAPIYDQHWGVISSTHQQFIERFASLLPAHSQVLDAACGTGRIWPVLLQYGHTVIGIDQSQGMLARARAKFPHVPVEQIGLQEMQYRGVFAGITCVDAMENVSPEDWPLVLAHFHRALKPQGYLYFTVEIASEHELEAAYAEGKRGGFPIVPGELIVTTTLEWALEGDYHYYPRLEQVREWLRQTSFSLLEEGEADEYHHFVARHM